MGYVNDVPPDWLILETVIRLQGQKRHEYNPTAPMIYKTIVKETGISYRWEFANERMEELARQRVLLRKSGDYLSSVRYRIHPDYYPEEPLNDPYTEAEREALRKRINPNHRSPEEIDREARERAEFERETKLRRQRLQRQRERTRGRMVRQSAYDLYQYGDMETPQVMELLDNDPGDVFVIDTETTGLDPYRDDVLEVSIINGYGRTVYTKRLNSWLEEWPEAQAIHGIGPQDVKDCPRLETEAPTISGLLRRARVIVGYNVFFDIGFLTKAGVIFPKVPTCDVMEEFSQIYGEWADWINDGEGGYKWQRLTDAGHYYHIDTQGAHGSLRDCQITLEVLRRVAREPERLRHRQRYDDKED